MVSIFWAAYSGPYFYSAGGQGFSQTRAGSLRARRSYPGGFRPCPPLRGNRAVRGGCICKGMSFAIHDDGQEGYVSRGFALDGILNRADLDSGNDEMLDGRKNEFDDGDQCHHGGGANSRC